MQDWLIDYPYRVITGLATGDVGPARRCQYPVGGHGAQTRFCGRRAQRGRSYCPRHLRRCIQADATAADDGVDVTHVTRSAD